MQDPQISNFYLANLNTHPVFSIFTSQQCLGNASKQKVEYNKKIRTCFYQGSLTKIPKFCLLIFTLGASGLNQKVAKNKKSPVPNFCRGPFYEKFWSSKIKVSPLASLAFQPCFLGPKLKIPLPIFLYCPPVDRPFLGVQAWRTQSISILFGVFH